MEKQTVFTAKLLQLCSTPATKRSVDDIRFIRDRLHERFTFFRAWPPFLQQLLCQLATSQRWVQQQVLLSARQAPTQLYFLLTGQVAICVRAQPDSSNLVGVTSLGPGDTCGEAALLGAPASSTFLVVRSREASAVAVDTQQLATRLQAYLAAATAAGEAAASPATNAGSKPTRAAAHSNGGGWDSSIGSCGGALDVPHPACPSTGRVGTSSSCDGSTARDTWGRDSAHSPGTPSAMPSTGCSSRALHSGASVSSSSRSSHAPRQQQHEEAPSSPQQHRSPRPGVLSQQWGDLQVLEDTCASKTAAELYSWIGVKPPLQPELLAPPGAGRSLSPTTSGAAAAAGQRQRQQQQHQQQGGAQAGRLGALERTVQLAGVSALEQEAAVGWREASIGRTPYTKCTAVTTTAVQQQQQQQLTPFAAVPQGAAWRTHGSLAVSSSRPGGAGRSIRNGGGESSSAAAVAGLPVRWADERMDGDVIHHQQLGGADAAAQLVGEPLGPHPAELMPHIQPGLLHRCPAAASLD